ncbi:winged helix-turn-helix transcriptional regulator [Methylorubrum populi]|uniref:winged helix-turn-helix transcriptional regulator n=1 Tax=Methylorubrum populi TaxID=223967 RepID=UPI0030846845
MGSDRSARSTRILPRREDPRTLARTTTLHRAAHGAGGIGRPMPTHRRRRFEAPGLVMRPDLSEIPPRAVPELTLRGASLRDIFCAMRE